MTGPAVKDSMNPGEVNPPSETNPHKGPGGAPGEAWDLEWAAERAADAMRYLALNCPASAGAPELHPHQDAAHEAAVAGATGTPTSTRCGPTSGADRRSRDGRGGCRRDGLRA